MKRIVSIAISLALTLVLSISAFAASGDVYEIYQDSMKSLGKASSIGYQVNIKMTMEEDGETTVVDQECILRQVINEDGTADMEVEIVYEDADNDYIYFKNDEMYISESAERKIKSSTAMSDIIAVLDSESGTLAALQEEMFDNATVEETENGNTRIRCSVDGEAYQKLANTVYDEMDLDASVEEISNIFYSILLDKDGEFKSLRCIMDASFEIEGDEVDVEYVIDMKVISVNQYRQIYFPSDLNLYV